MLSFRDVLACDLPQLLALNNQAGPGIVAITVERLALLFDQAAYFRVAEIDGQIAGFLIALRTNADYDSPNFAWFKAHIDDFVYIDRIVIGAPFRGHGLGRVFYADVQGFAEVRSPILACEVFLEPADAVSVLFHGTWGFREVTQLSLGKDRRVSLLTKPLCSWDWVRDTYWLGPQKALPPVPWLAERKI